MTPKGRLWVLLVLWSGCRAIEGKGPGCLDGWLFNHMYSLVEVYLNVTMTIWDRVRCVHLRVFFFLSVCPCRYGLINLQDHGGKSLLALPRLSHGRE